jgi:hypothetical protein
LPKAETTRRALLQDGDLMAEGNDLSLLSSTGPKCRGHQSQKSDEKWSHRGNDDDLTNEAKPAFSIRTGFSVSTGGQPHGKPAVGDQRCGATEEKGEEQRPAPCEPQRSLNVWAGHARVCGTWAKHHPQLWRHASRLYPDAIHDAES